MGTRPTEATLRIGTAGWSYDDWNGIVYPAGMKEHRLSYLARFFDTVEVNSSFYRPPSARHCLSWLDKASENPRFKFTLKLWQRFTHEGASISDTDVRAYIDGIEPIDKAGKLGGILVQFPWSFKRNVENRRWLANVIRAFQRYPLVLEVRHASWDCPEFYTGLAEHGIAFCNIDQPLFDDSIAPSAHTTARVGYVRLHGRNYENWFSSSAGRDARYDYLYSEEELQPWIDKIKRIRDEAEEVYVITNNHYRGQAVVNALQMEAQLGTKTRSLPEHLIQHYPRLKSLSSTTESPGPLFG